MDYIKIAELNREECLEVKDFDFRRIALFTLYANLKNTGNQRLSEKVMNDLSQTQAKIKDWWSRMGLKYQFTPSPKLSIDYQTGSIHMALSDTANELDVF
jgi:CXXX repeat modification system protein